MVARGLVSALAKARRQMLGARWQRLAAAMAGLPGGPDAASIQRVMTGLENRDAAWLLSEALAMAGDSSWAEIGAAMQTVDYLVGDNTPLTEIMWTGPANQRFPVRRLDQVLYDLIAAANRRIVLVTFAAHRVQQLCDLLTQAVERGVELSLIVESEAESEGQLTFDAVMAFRSIPATRMQLYYWPLAKRERNQAGRPGKLHMKCAIVDDVALIGSANLTDDAFNRNMELGLLVREPGTVEALSEHLAELIRAKILLPIRPG